jgi:hypothetical protein
MDAGSYSAWMRVALRAAVALSLPLVGAALLAVPAHAERLKLRPLSRTAAESVRLFHPRVRDRVRATPLKARAARRAQAQAAETRFRTQDGYEIPVAVSSAYTPDPGVEQGYVNFLDGLVHGPELGKISIYIATPSQIENTFCGQGALACYVGDDEQMYVPGVAGHSDPPVQFLIAHEYGHHIELNRSNSPWSAYDQGTKRWATHENVCTLERSHKVRTDYYNDPSEAFAESYADMQFPGVDFIYTDLLKPDQGAFDAIRADVLQPWSGPRSLTLSGSSSRTFRLPTPLDGNASFRLSTPAGTSYRIGLLSGGHRLRRRSTRPVGTANYTICGARTVTLKLTRVAGRGRFTVSARLP